MAIEELLDGHAPTEAWLATDDASRLLSDVERRAALYRALHPRPHPSHAPLLRALLAHEVALRQRPSDDDTDDFEQLYWCALLLSQIGDLEDVLRLWHAKHTTFDTYCAFDIQFLVGAGVTETLAFLVASDDPAASDAAGYISSCDAAGDFDDLEAWLAYRCSYFERFTRCLPR